MLSLSQKINLIFPDAKQMVDFVARDDSDGKGEYIAEWNLDAPQPTIEELEAAWAEYQANPPAQPLTDAQRIANLMLQSAEKDAQIKTLEQKDSENLMQLADKEIRLKMVESQNANIMLKLALNGIK